MIIQAFVCHAKQIHKIKVKTKLKYDIISVINRHHTKEIHMETIQIQYLDNTIEKLAYIDGKSDWIDLRSAVDVELKAGEFKLIHLGIAMKLPEGYEAHGLYRAALPTRISALSRQITAVLSTAPTAVQMITGICLLMRCVIP